MNRIENTPSFNVFCDLQVRETALRRQLFADMTDLSKVLNRSNDEMTQILRQWLESFKMALKTPIDEKTLLDQHLALLQSLLIDCISLQPLNKNCVLGSDGKTYNQNTIQLYKRGVPSQFQNHSPSNPQHSNFSFTSHPTVGPMIEWMEKHQELHHQNIGVTHPNVPDQTRVYSVAAKIALLKENERKRQEELFKELCDFDAILQTESEMDLAIDQILASISSETEAWYQNENKKIDGVENNLKLMCHELDEMCDRLDHKIHDLQVNTQAIDDQLIKIQEATDLIQQQNLQIGKAIEEVKIAQAKAKKGWLKDLGQAALLIGACAFSTWALQAALSSTGSSLGGVILPHPGGRGVMTGISVAL